MPVFAAGEAKETAQTPVSFDKQVRSWQQDLEAIEKVVASGSVVVAEQSRAWREQFNEIRGQAGAEARDAKAMLTSEKAILKTLGEAPKNPQDEAESVRKQRQKFNDAIAQIDRQVKLANLTIAKIDELKSLLDTREKTAIKNKLLSRSLVSIYPESWQLVAGESFDFVAGFSQWVPMALMLAGMLVLSLLSLPVTGYLNRSFEKSASVKLLRPFSRKRLLVFSAVAYLVFLLRVAVLKLTGFPALEDALQAAASICLALILFGALRKVAFINNTKSDERLGEIKRSYHSLFNIVRRLAQLVLLCVPPIALAGYISFALYLAFNIALTFCAGLLFVWLRGVAVKISCKLTPPHQDSPKELSPIAITLLEPVLALFSILLILFFWGMTTEDMATWFSEFGRGITIGDMTIDFVSIGAAITLFATLYFATKLIQWFLSNRVFQHTKLDSGIQNAILAITGYVGIVLALIAGMSAVGLDMSNIAIVAGALSVGIGFGLQAIFNNFVSGLILLFERPVKVGDWVVVGGHQGIIKKIRVRSTEIETFLNSSVIVPNSQLISETVTNWTLHDRAGRVDVGVGVAYGSDTEKVKTVLLEVAKAHKQVRSYPAPAVIFTNFGDSSLDFELRCFIHNIRDIYTVSSDLRFAVDAAFREHTIEIPFPQRDLHIRSAETLNIHHQE